jgi:hypothetical protein
LNCFDNTTSSFLSSENASTSSSLDLLFSIGTDKLGLDNNGGLDITSTEELEHSVLSEINHRGLGSILLSLFLSLLRKKVPNFIKVHDRAILSVALKVEMSHTDLTEMTRVAKRIRSKFLKDVQLIEKDTEMMLTTSITTTRRMTTMLTYTMRKTK